MVAGDVAYVAVNDADAQAVRVGVGFEGPRLFVTVVTRSGRNTSDAIGTVLTRTQRNECLAQRVGRD